MPHALVELGGLRGLLSRLQERPVRRGAGERKRAAAVHTQHGLLCALLSAAAFTDKRFPVHAKTRPAAVLYFSEEQVRPRSARRRTFNCARLR